MLSVRSALFTTPRPATVVGILVIPYVSFPTDTWRRLRIIKHDESFSLFFFLPEREYMELELRSVELQGAHEAGGHAPHPRG